jgi:hypothetical protein
MNYPIAGSIPARCNSTSSPLATYGDDRLQNVAKCVAIKTDFV